MGILKKYIGIGCMIVVSCCLAASCNYLENSETVSLLTKVDKPVNNKQQATVTNFEFTKDYRFLDISLKLNEGIDVELSDTVSVRTQLHQLVGFTRNTLGEDRLPPVIYDIHNVAKDEVAASNIKIMMLVDLSLSQDLVDREREAVKQARTILAPNQLYVAFMQGGQVSESYALTDYIISNYFISESSSSNYLYHSVLTKLVEMTDSTSLFADAEHKGLIVLSGGKTYDNDRPIDPRHFSVQQRLTELIPALNQRNISVYSALFSASAKQSTISELSLNDGNRPVIDAQQELGVLRLICNQTNGAFLSLFDWKTICEDFMSDHKIDYDDYHITLLMPDGKVFRGNLTSVDIDFIDKQTGNKIVTSHLDYSAGNVFYPIVIGGKSLSELLFRGLLVAFCLMLVVWIALQLVLPWLRYQMFLRKHVIRYAGPQMSKDGLMLAESCYLCKGQFELGDEVVTKCRHTMHKECWDENGYQCPEHGRNCRHGSHYYNSKNMFDSRNATFYLQWILAGMIAGWLAWMFFLLRMHLYDNSLLTHIMLFIFGIQAGSPEADQFIADYAVHMDYQPAFGFFVSFFITLCLSLLSLRGIRWTTRIIDALIRAFIAGVLGCLSFAINCILAVIIGIKTNSVVLDCIPWILMTAIIMYSVTCHTRVRTRPLWLFIACLSGVISMYIWTLVFQIAVDFRLFLLLSFLLTSVVLAVCIAFEAPKSEHYFLQASGAIKPIEIALYKWLRSNPSAVITMGQSVDCSIHLSWDISSNVAPVHAELFLRRSTLYIKALEKGVILNGKELEAGDSDSLSHGSHFIIGNTTFTYVEKDL